jgi:ribosomal protein S6--L-glutamate ligase
LSAVCSHGTPGSGIGGTLARVPQCPHARGSPNFTDYSEEETQWIRKAGKIYYPTAFYADLFDAVGKQTFPSYHTYKCVQDKIKQSALFQLAGLPHPKTRVFYGKRQQSKIREYFSYPCIAKAAWIGHGAWRVFDQERR